MEWFTRDVYITVDLSQWMFTQDYCATLHARKISDTTDCCHWLLSHFLTHLAPAVTSPSRQAHAARRRRRVSSKPSGLRLAVVVNGPVASDDGTSSVRHALIHGEHRIVVLLVDLELSPSAEEVVVGPASQIDDCSVVLIERAAEEDGLQEALLADLAVLLEPGHEALALSAGAVALEDDHELDGAVEALDSLSFWDGSERAVVGGVDLGLLEGGCKGLFHLGPGGGEGRRASVIAGASLVLAHDVPSVVPLAVGREGGTQDTDVASHCRAGGGCGDG